MQFVRRGEKIQVYKYAGYDKEKKRSKLTFLGSMEKDGTLGRKLDSSMRDLDEKDKSEIKEKQRILKQDALLRELPTQMLFGQEAMEKMSHDEMHELLNFKDSAIGRTWQEQFAFYLSVMSEYIAFNTNDKKIAEYFEHVRDAYHTIFRKTD